MQALTVRLLRALGAGGRRSFLRRRGVSRLHRTPVWRAMHLLTGLPRGAGFIASALYLAAWGGYGMVLSGQTLAVVNDTTAELGFKVDEVIITGQRELNELDVLDVLSIPSGQSLFLYDADAARERLGANPWVAAVSVMKLYPGKVRVILEERVPTALWQKTPTDPAAIIDGAGKVITSDLRARYVNLPRVIGPGAETRVAEIMSILDDVPAIKDRVTASMLVSERRWDLFLDNGVQVMLPVERPAEAAAELARLEEKGHLLDRDITVVDLRLPDRMVVRLSDTAKAARDELVKAREKTLKQRMRDA